MRSGVPGSDTSMISSAIVLKELGPRQEQRRRRKAARWSASSYRNVGNVNEVDVRER